MEAVGPAVHRWAPAVGLPSMAEAVLVWLKRTRPSLAFGIPALQHATADLLVATELAYPSQRLSAARAARRVETTRL